MRLTALSLASLFAAGIALSFVAPWAALICYAVVTSVWLVPDRRIEKMLAAQDVRETF